MNIVFVCGSLEPGKDGVGDYTRRLACGLKRLGHQVMLVAVNDRHCKEWFTGVQYAEEVVIPVTRVPATMHADEKLRRLKKVISNFNPQWLSLQFVPFAFNDKGLFFGLANFLVKLGEGCSWHVMFHELWVGMEKESPAKHLWWGMLQKRLITSLLNKLKPAAIHTQASLYLLQLQKMGFQASHLPLFSNIPVNPPGSALTTATGDDASAKKVSFVLFAAIHQGAPAESFARDVAAYGKAAGIKFKLVIVGRCGAGQNAWAKAWADEGMEVSVLGEQPAQRLSEIFFTASAGISTTPYALAEKSGAVAAMQEHGLPVICVSYPWTPRWIKNLGKPKNIAAYPDWNIEEYVMPRLKQITDSVASASTQLASAFALHQ